MIKYLAVYIHDLTPETLPGTCLLMYILQKVRDVFRRKSLGPENSFAAQHQSSVFGMDVPFLPVHATISAILDLCTSKTGAVS